MRWAAMQRNSLRGENSGTATRVAGSSAQRIGAVVGRHRGGVGQDRPAAPASPWRRAPSSPAPGCRRPRPRASPRRRSGAASAGSLAATAGACGHRPARRSAVRRPARPPPARAARTAARGRRAGPAPRRTARRARRSPPAPAARRRSPRRAASAPVRARGRAAPRTAAPARSTARAIRSSSFRPPSGLVSRQAKFRSSCGSSSASASAIRSCTAGCSVSTRRSSPATGTPRVFSARTRARAKALRRRTSTSTSPGCQRAAAAFQHHVAGGLRADPVGQRVGQTLRRGVLVLVGSATSQGCRLRRVRQRRQRPQLDGAGMVGAVGVVLQGLAGFDDAGGGDAGRRTPRPPGSAPAGWSGTTRPAASCGISARRRSRGAPAGRASGRTRRRRRPGTSRSTACGRRRRTRCGVASRAPAPAKNSAVRAWAMLPLRRRGVLHLVEQQVVEAAVELVEHPGGAGIDQQLRGAADQVVVVHQAAVLLVRRRRRAAPARPAPAGRRRGRPSPGRGRSSISARMRSASATKTWARSGMAVGHRLADEGAGGARPRPCR